MSAWIEVYVKGGHRAVLAADSVVGIIVPKGGDAHTVGTPDAGLTLILRGGETLPPVYDICAADLILRCDAARMVDKRRAAPSLIVQVDQAEDLWAKLDELMRPEP